MGYYRERIQGHFEDGSDWAVDIRYVPQSAPKGTGNALLQAEASVDDHCIVANGDRIVSATAFEKTADHLTTTDADATLAVTPTETPSDHGVVTLEGNRIVDLVEKPPTHSTDSDLANVGVYGFSPEVRERLLSPDSDRTAEHVPTACRLWGQ